MTDNHNCGHVPVLGCLNELTSFCCFWFRGDDPSNLCCKCPKIMSTSCKSVGNKCFARDHLCLTLGASQHCPFPESNVSTVHFGKAIKRPRPTLSSPSSPLEPLELPEPSGQSGQPWHLIPRPTNSISQLISSQQLSSFPTAVRVKDTQRKSHRWTAIFFPCCKYRRPSVANTTSTLPGIAHPNSVFWSVSSSASSPSAPDPPNASRTRSRGSRPPMAMSRSRRPGVAARRP